MAVNINELAGRYRRVQEQVEQACLKANRDPAEVRLLAVSKTFPASAVRALHGLGQADFGENYVQEASVKAAELAADAGTQGLRWHLIGPLQRNKARVALGFFDVFHSVDRLELALRLESLADQMGRSLDAFVQVNLAGEASKSGLDPLRVREELERWNQHSWKRIRWIGLMTIPPAGNSLPYFYRLAELRDGLQADAFSMFSQFQLSMGMSDDFEAAIAAGSNWIRIGRAIFGDR